MLSRVHRTRLIIRLQNGLFIGDLAWIGPASIQQWASLYRWSVMA